MLAATEPNSSRVGVMMASRGCESAGKMGWSTGAERGALRNSPSLLLEVLVMMRDLELELELELDLGSRRIRSLRAKPLPQAQKGRL